MEVFWESEEMESSLPKKIDLYFDRDLSLRVEVIGPIKAKGRFQVKEVIPDCKHVFYVWNGNTYSLACRLKVFVNEVEPIGVEEDNEDEALTYLFDQADRFFDPENRGISGRLWDKDRNKRSMVLSNLPGGGTLKVAEDINVITKQLGALSMLAFKPRPHHKPLLRLLVSNKDANWDDFETKKVGEFHILTDTSRDGYEEQRRFVEIALSTPDYAILEGPPGSGKTTTLIEIILQLIKQGKRVMMVASTHVAVDNILERLCKEDPKGSLIDKFGIVPLRIGQESVVSEKIKRFCLDNAVETERASIRDNLAKLPKRSPAQERFYQCLKDRDKGSEIIEEMCISMANFVCGTTIGILHYPQINASVPERVFDYLILDEASKTTFQEFLVPALYAERWIISGDPKQLAPYVEEVHLMENLRDVAESEGFGNGYRSVCLNLFEAWNGLVRFGGNDDAACTLLIAPDDSEIFRLYEIQLAAMEAMGMDEMNRGVPVSVVSRKPDHVMKASITVSDLVVVKESLLFEVIGLLPPGKIAVNDISMLNMKGLNKQGRFVRIEENDRREGSWEGQVTWRLCRMYETITNPKKHEMYKTQIDLLMPRETSDDGEGPMVMFRELEKKVHSIRRVALPSILDLLMVGFEPHRARENNTISLYTGLPDMAMSRRWKLLTYQQRMHPDISRFPREKIYDNNALKDAKGMDERRGLDSYPYHSRAFVIPIRPTRRSLEGASRNHNPLEVRSMLDELDKILKWTASHPNPENEGGTWSVAMLTFYRGQEKELAQAVRDKFKVVGGGYFDLKKWHVEVEVGNVDRFQGHEADFVMLSFVRCDAIGKGIGFLDNRNRLNVALTRAKYQLILFADKKYFLERGTQLHKELFSSIEDNISYGG